MLSASEFTVGTLADAKPLSLMLSITQYDSTFLVGWSDDGAPTAVFMGQKFKFIAFECSTNTRWDGLIIPHVRIEIDETSLTDSRPPGSLIRDKDTLSIKANFERSPIGSCLVALETGLNPTHNLSAAFSKWQIVLGEYPNKRVLLTIDLNEENEHPA